MTWEVGGKDMMADRRKGTERIKSSLWRRPRNKQTQGARLQNHWVGVWGAAGLQSSQQGDARPDGGFSVKVMRTNIIFKFMLKEYTH